jgi:hypothetical protein
MGLAIGDVDRQCPFVVGLDIADRGKRPVRSIADVILRGRALQHVFHARMVGDHKVSAGLRRWKVSFLAKFSLNGRADAPIDQ